MPQYMVPGHIQDVDGYDRMKSQTYTEKFSQAPLALSEKPKTPTALSQKDNAMSPVQAVSAVNQEPLFESYVPPRELSKASTPVHKPQQETSVTQKPKTPTPSVLPSVVKKPASVAGSVDDSKPLHKRIDREEYVKDVANFYGGSHQPEAPSKISKLIEELDNQKKVMDKLDRKQKDVLANSKMENRRTAAQMIDKFIQTA